MSQIWDQLKQWPPTSSTVVGFGMIFGLVSYWLTGSFEIAAAVASVFKVLCPQDAPAVDQAMNLDRQLATTPKP